MVRSKVTIYQVIKDVIPNIKGLNTTNSAHFKQETFLRWAINQNRNNQFFFTRSQQLCGKSFLFQTTEFPHSHYLDHYCNLLISKEVNIPSWQMKVWSCYPAHKIPHVVQHEICSLQCEFFFICLFESDHFYNKGFFEKLSLEPNAWMYLAKHQQK